MIALPILSTVAALAIAIELVLTWKEIKPEMRKALVLPSLFQIFAIYVVLAQGATTDSGINRQAFNNQVDFAPISDFGLLKTAYEKGVEADYEIRVGNVFTSDRFYNDELDKQKLADHGVLAIEMEASALYTIAAKHGKKALAILTISDHILTGEETTAEEREKTFDDMMIIALETAVEHN